MLHRPKTTSFAPSLPFRPSYADRTRRKRTHSPSFTLSDYSLSENISLHDAYNNSCDSRFISSMYIPEKHSDYDPNEMFLSDSFFQECSRLYDPSEVGKPFRPPSPRPEEYEELNECNPHTSFGHNQKSDSLILQKCSNESTSEGNGQENETDEPRPSKSVDLFCEASSLHEKMLSFSEDLNALIKRRKRTDAECRQTALEISASPRALSGNI